MNVLGIMNGTSLDAVDLVLCKIQKKPFSCKLLGHAQFEFPHDLVNDLRTAARHELTVDRLALAHHDLGRFYAHICRDVIRKKKWKVDVVGVHGQTVYHAPPHGTLQIGEMAYLKAELDLPIVSDFRTLDLALGGQGAPLATLFHERVLAPLAEDLWKKTTKSGAPKKEASALSSVASKTLEGVAIQNLGGIANVSYFGSKKALAFDTGPANMLIDMAVRRLTSDGQSYDVDGRIASHGLPVPEVITNWWRSHAYFEKAPPKSCGREEFGESFFENAMADLHDQSREDIIATFTEFTALTIAESYKRFLPKIPRVVVLCGGGAKNPVLKESLSFRLPHSLITTSDALGWPSDTIEGAAFALLAAFRIWGWPSNLPKTTGASRAASLGQIL